MNKKNGSGLFLMEMIMAVAFFIIAASICILVFVKANQMSRLARDTNQSVIYAESIGEVFKGLGTAGLVEQLGAVSHETRPDTYEIFLDDNFSETTRDQAAFYAEILVNDESGLSGAYITICSYGNDQLLYELEVKQYQKP